MNKVPTLRTHLTALALALLALPAFAQTSPDTPADTAADTTRDVVRDDDGFDWGLLGLLGLLGLIPRKRHDTHTHTTNTERR